MNVAYKEVTITSRNLGVGNVNHVLQQNGLRVIFYTHALCLTAKHHHTFQHLVAHTTQVDKSIHL